MKVLIKDIANIEDLNPDQMAAFAREHSEEYDTEGEGVDDSTIEEEFIQSLIGDFEFENRKGHDWRENLVSESLNEAMDFKRGRNIKKTLEIGLSSHPEHLKGKIFRAKVYSGVNYLGKITNSSRWSYISEGDYIYTEVVSGPDDEGLLNFWCFKFKNLEDFNKYDIKNLERPNHLDIMGVDWKSYYMTWGTFQRRFEYIPEELYEAMDFERGQDPKKVMGLGKRVQIEKDLEEVGIRMEDVEILDDFVILNKGVGFSAEDNLYIIQLKYMPAKKAAFVEDLRNSKGDPKEAVDQALEDGIPSEEIRVLIDEFGKYENGYQTIDHKTPAVIHLTKVTRDEETIEYDEEYNTYAFIGFMDKKPITVNGKQYYEDKFSVEAMIKIDRYDQVSLNSVTGMKLRARYDDHDSNVYFVKVPKDMMDEERYKEIPDHMQEIIEKYKQRA